MKRLALIAFNLLFLLPISLLAQSPLLPPSHPAYDFLDRMETLGLLDHPLMGSKPVSRERIGELLDEVLGKTDRKSLTAKQPLLLSRVDRETLAALRWELGRDAARSERTSPPAVHPDGISRWGRINGWMASRNWFTRAFYANGINLYSYETDAFDGYFDPRGLARVIRQEGESESIVITGVGIRLRGHLYNRLGIYFDFLDTTERGRGPYQDRTQLYEDRTGYVGNPKGEASINYDVSEFDLAIGGEFWELHAAKMPLRWGPGRSGQLLLSDYGTSFHQLQGAFTMGSKLCLVYVFGSLKTYPDLGDTLYYTNSGYYRTIEAQKYIAAHRLEWNPHPRFRLAFAEAVIFGERNPELAYLIPINLFYSAEHDLGDEDNALMSFDATWIPLPSFKLFGELLIDDITTGKLGSDFFGNKLGWLGGFSWVEPGKLRNLDATFEIVQLRPFVYTNRYPVNVYTHWTAPLGYYNPPNSQTLYSTLRYRPHRRVLLQGSWTYLKHGANSDDLNAGGDIHLPHKQGTSEDAPFLGGDLQESNQFVLEGRYELLLGLYLWSRAAWTDYEGEDSWEWEVGFRLN